MNMSGGAGAMLASGDYRDSRATGMMIARHKSLMHINRVVVLISKKANWSVEVSDNRALLY